MKTTLYLTVALLSIALLIQSRCDVREAYGFTHRAQAQTERAIKVADDWRLIAERWEKSATNCISKLRGQE